MRTISQNEFDLLIDAAYIYEEMVLQRPNTSRRAVWKIDTIHNLRKFRYFCRFYWQVETLKLAQLYDVQQMLIHYGSIFPGDLNNFVFMNLVDARYVRSAANALLSSWKRRCSTAGIKLAA